MLEFIHHVAMGSQGLTAWTALASITAILLGWRAKDRLPSFLQTLLAFILAVSVTKWPITSCLLICWWTFYWNAYGFCELDRYYLASALLVSLAVCAFVADCIEKFTGALLQKSYRSIRMIVYHCTWAPIETVARAVFRCLCCVINSLVALVAPTILRQAVEPMDQEEADDHENEEESHNFLDGTEDYYLDQSLEDEEGSVNDEDYQDEELSDVEFDSNDFEPEEEHTAFVYDYGRLTMSELLFHDD